RQGDTDKAIKAVERALRLDKRNPQALNTLRALRSGGAVSLPTDSTPPVSKPKTTEDQSILDLFKEEMVDARKKVGDADPLGPLGEAMTEAQSMLAAYVMESGSMDMATASAMQGMELQRQSQYSQAVESYTKAVQGKIRHPALQLNLGGLLYITEQYELAIKSLTEAVTEPKLASGALHALGLAHYKLGKQKQASRFLIQSLQAVDALLAANKKEEAELAATYNQLLTALDGRSDEMLAAINQRFSDLLSGADWKKRVAETRKHLEEVFHDPGEQGVVDFLGTGGSEKLATTLASIDNYIQRGLLTLAMDECHNAMLASPYYLPLHVRMAEIMMREGRLRQAINKYNVIAKAYMSRDENARATSILAEVLEMAPLDISVRASLIALLESEERFDEMLDQYIELAKTHNQLGNFELSRETFQQAERTAKRLNSDPIKLVEIKHNLADMDQIRLDTRRALRTYEEILDLMPEDERAYRALIDLHYSQNNQLEATKNLDKLLN
ncbi:MAG TPA: tetratricopeptide repeat protein, partial [Aggregatilineales bacterium]|nr:tetratricopeptide repeat protein [Aggregatilineales bacterium]